MIHCRICYTENVDPEWVCDRCEQHYCEDCSYTFSLHYQHQGNRCYQCADQSRREKLPNIDILRDRKIKIWANLFL